MVTLSSFSRGTLGDLIPLCFARDVYRVEQARPRVTSALLLILPARAEIVVDEDLGAQFA